GENLALVDQARLVRMNELDRILDRHDVVVALAVDLVDHGGERRRFAGAGGAGDEDQSLGPIGELLHDLREAELLERADLVRDDADRAADRTALSIDVAAEAREALDTEREVELVLFLELLLLAFVQDAVRKPLGVLRRQDLELVELIEAAVDTDLRVR